MKFPTIWSVNQNPAMTPEAKIEHEITQLNARVY